MIGPSRPGAPVQGRINVASLLPEIGEVHRFVYGPPSFTRALRRQP